MSDAPHARFHYSRLSAAFCKNDVRQPPYGTCVNSSDPLSFPGVLHALALPCHLSQVDKKGEGLGSVSVHYMI